MKILFGGVRGSIPCAAPDYVNYGGHTTCMLISGQGGELLMLDAGSGVRTLSQQLATAGAVGAVGPDGTDSTVSTAPTEGTQGISPAPHLHILLTHLHLDHLLGLPMLSVLFDPSWTVTIMGVKPAKGTLQMALERLIAPPLWPFTLTEFPATVEIMGFARPDEIPACGNLVIQGVAVPHPNGCHAWRIDESTTGQAIVLATDMEWSAASLPQRQALLSLCAQPQPVDLLVMDGHFAPHELPGKAGWGHSSTEECLDVAQNSGARRLLITHHAPDHDDATLCAMDHHIQGLWSGAALARQAMEVSLDQSARKDP